MKTYNDLKASKQPKEQPKIPDRREAPPLQQPDRRDIPKKEPEPFKKGEQPGPDRGTGSDPRPKKSEE